MAYAKSNDVVSDCCGAEIDYEAGIKVCSECGERCQVITEDEWEDREDDKEDE